MGCVFIKFCIYKCQAYHGQIVGENYQVFLKPNKHWNAVNVFLRSVFEMAKKTTYIIRRPNNQPTCNEVYSKDDIRPAGEWMAEHFMEAESSLPCLQKPINLTN
jgi:hypothetical protein